jgi:hypothetical protein
MAGVVAVQYNEAVKNSASLADPVRAVRFAASAVTRSSWDIVC